MNRLVLIGAGGHGKVVADTAEADGYREIVFTDQIWPTQSENGRWSIVGGINDYKDEQRFCSIGDNATRARIFGEQSLKDSPVLVHPSAVLSPTAQLGAGTLVVAGAIINADVTIGYGGILNTACSVDHDCKLGEFVHISPGSRLAGNVTVGARSWIGIGAVVKEGITIGQDVTVAAGAVVVRDIKDGEHVAGVPARNMGL